MDRRELIKALGITTGLSFLSNSSDAAPWAPPANSFTYCLNMATIRGHKLGFVKEIETASRAGFKSVEIWIESLQTYIKNGGTLRDAKKRLDDLGIKVENAIGFAKWIVDDDSERKKGLEQMQQEMETLAQIGCKRVAAPPAGATDASVIDLRRVAERYRAILDLGTKTGVVPHLELWGFSKNLSHVSEVIYVALESGHSSAKVLLDVYHIYKGGSPIETLPLVSSDAIELLHVNDYPANMPSSTITDADRIFTGDGVAPIGNILRTLKNPKTPLVISLEVFNKKYYALNPLEVAKTGLAKMKAIAGAV